MKRIALITSGFYRRKEGRGIGVNLFLLLSYLFLGFSFLGSRVARSRIKGVRNEGR